MTDAGRKVLPDMRVGSFKLDEDIKKALKKAGALEIFDAFPDLYKRIKTYNLTFYKKLDVDKYKKALLHFIEETSKGKMYGTWNDYGRLINY